MYIRSHSNLVTEVEVHDITDITQHDLYRSEIARWSDEESMIPITFDSIAGHHLSTVALAHTTEGIRLAGYCAITQIYSRYIIELGGLIVSPDFRGMRVAQQVVKRVVARATEELEPDMILAFSNKNSASIFQKLGGEVIADATTLPHKVWKLCINCRNYQEAVIECGMDCCGRVYDITRIETE
jgi:N-acetylglutamate synthase-like GNAT family acetyltransferase